MSKEFEENILIFLFRFCVTGYKLTTTLAYIEIHTYVNE